MRASIGLALAIAIATASAFSSADPANYQKYVIGERALGMGGAQTAAVNDPMACLYNPAGMVFATSSMVSASKSIYSLDYRIVEGGFVPSSTEATDAVSLEYENDLTLPSTLALMVRFGPRIYKKGPRQHAIGVAVLTPFQDSYTLTGKWSASGALRDRETYSLSESSTVVWSGLSYAYRFNRGLGAGLSAFLVDSSFERTLATSRFEDGGSYDQCGLYRCGYMEFRESTFQSEVVSLLFQAGLLWEPGEHWRIGIMIRSPSIMLGDLYFIGTKGSLDQTWGAAYMPNTGDDYIEYYTDDYDLKVAEYEPLAIRMGYAYIVDKEMAVDFDVTAHAPISYHRLRGDPVAERAEEAAAEGETDASPYWFDDGIVRKIEREPVVNLNLGGEWIIQKEWTLRTGLFTNFSWAPAPKPSPEPQLTKMDTYGASFSLGYQSEGYDVAIGAIGSMGWGEASVFHYDAPDGNFWRPAPTHGYSVYIFLAGVQKAVVDTAKELWTEYWDKKQEEEEAARARAAAGKDGTGEEAGQVTGGVPGSGEKTGS